MEEEITEVDLITLLKEAATRIRYCASEYKKIEPEEAAALLDIWEELDMFIDSCDMEENSDV